MSRVIRIESCAICPSRDHKGAFAQVAYVPVCRNRGNRELPHTLVMSRGGSVSASATFEIPEWCPLEKYQEQAA